MVTIDIILLLVFIVAAWLGFRKGFITQLGSVAAIVVAIIACRLFGQSVEEIIMGQHPEWDSGFSHYAVSIVANCLIYVLVYYAVLLVARLLHQLTHVVFLSPADHIAGAAFSVAKYGLLVSLLLNLYIALFPDTKLLANSRLAGGKVVELTVEFAPWVLDTINPVTPSAGDEVEGEDIPVDTAVACANVF